MLGLEETKVENDTPDVQRWQRIRKQKVWSASVRYVGQFTRVIRGSNHSVRLNLPRIRKFLMLYGTTGGDHRSPGV